MNAALATAPGEIPLRRRDAPAPAVYLGLEHEYRVLKDGAPVDFRDIVHFLPVPGQRLDPGDSNAYRLFSGMALTCDEAEAEIATPPIPVVPGFDREIAAWAEYGRGVLRDLLPAGYAVEGYSTHVSVSLADGLQHRTIELFLPRFGPCLLPLMTEESGFGIYLRPRPGRLEACGDYVRDERLAEAARLLLGGVLLCAEAAETGDTTRLPRPQPVSTSPATGRPGWYLPRKFSASPAQVQEALQTVSPMLPCAADSPPLLSCSERPELGSQLLTRVERPAFRVEAIAATWDFAVFALQGARRAFACVPARDLGSFEQDLGAGALDDVIGRYLSSVPTGRRLDARSKTQYAALWDSLAAPRTLLPEEPVALPGAGRTVERLQSVQPLAKAARIGKPTAAWPAPAPVPLPRDVPAPPPPDRPDSPPPPPPDRPDSPPPPPPPPAAPPAPPSKPWLALTAATVVAAAVLAAAAAATGIVGGQGGDDDPVAISTSTPAATATAVPVVATEPALALTPTATPGASGTPAATAPAAPAATSTSVPASPTSPPPAPTAAPTNTPLPPTITPTRLPCDPPGAVAGCTPTPVTSPSPAPSPTVTRSPTPAATAVPTPTPCVAGPGTVCPSPTPGLPTQ